MNSRDPLTASVIIATYNRPDHVRTCLEHVFRQTTPAQQTIVVDASADRQTAEVVASFPGVVYLRNELGRGHTATSRAIGMRAATGAIVAFIDDDAYAEPAWLAELLKRYDDPLVGAVGGLTRNGQPGEATEGLGQIGLLLPDGRLTGYFAADPGRDLDVDHLIGANMSVRRSFAVEVGGIHDHYPGTCFREETDIQLRLARRGYRIVFTPAARVDHVGGTYAKGRRFDTRYQYYGARNHIVLLTHTLGFKDPHLRRYMRTVGRAVLQDLKAAVRAPLDKGRGPIAKLRGAGGGVVRAATAVVGTMVGLAASVRVALSERDRRVTQDHSSQQSRTNPN